MAPYHRIGRSIVEGSHLLLGDPEASETGIRSLDVDYVVACSAPDWSAEHGGVGAPMGGALGLRDVLARGEPPAFLKPVSLPKATQLRVYRVLPPKS